MNLVAIPRIFFALKAKQISVFLFPGSCTNILLSESLRAKVVNTQGILALERSMSSSKYYGHYTLYNEPIMWSRDFTLWKPQNTQTHYLFFKTSALQTSVNNFKLSMFNVLS